MAYLHYVLSVILIGTKIQDYILTGEVWESGLNHNCVLHCNNKSLIRVQMLALISDSLTIYDREAQRNTCSKHMFCCNCSEEIQNVEFHVTSCNVGYWCENQVLSWRERNDTIVGDNAYFTEEA